MRMPTAAQINRPGGVRSGRIAPNGPAVQIGPAISSLGASLQAGANDLDRVVARQDMDQQKRDNEYERLFTQMDQQRTAAQKIEAANLYDQRSTAVEASLIDVEKNTPASGDGYLGRALEVYDQQNEQFLKSIPEERRPEYSQMLQTERAKFALQQGTLETQKRKGWYVDNLGKNIDGASTAIFNDPTSFDSRKNAVLQRLEASDLLTPAEKEEIKGKIDTTLSAAVAERLFREDPVALERSLGVAPPSRVGFGDPSLPAGMRNNNPGNIKYVGQGSDKGVVGPSENTDQGDPQAVYETPEAGMRDMYRLLRKKYDGGKTTPNSIIAENGGWTPGNFQAARNVANSLGIGPDDDIAINDPDGAARFMRALIKQEHGSASQAYSDEMIAAAIGGGPLPAGGQRRRQSQLDASGATGALPNAGGNFGLLATSADLENVQPVVIDRFKALQNQFGRQFKISSGFRDQQRNARAGGAKGSQHIHGNALDVDVSDMSKDERVQFLRMASAVGFTGIGVGSNSVHLDVGNRRAWGYKTSAGGGDVPGWAQEVIGEHLSGKIEAPGGAMGGGAVTAPGYALDPRLSGLPFAERLKLADRARGAIADRQSAEATQAKAQYGQMKDALELSIMTGGVSSEMEILNNPVLDDGDKSSMLRTFRAQQQEKSETDLAVESYIAGEATDWNPLDGDDRNTAGKVFKAIDKKLEGQPEEVRQSFADDFIRDTGIIPDPIGADIRRDAMSQEPEKVAAGLTQAARINRVAPEAFETMQGGTDVRRDLTSFEHLVNNRGFSSEQAAARIIERRSPEYQRSQELWKTEADKKAREIDLATVTNEFDPGLFSSEPGPGNDQATKNLLLSDYREVFREEFIKAGGDEDEAKKQTKRELSRVWGVSETSGEQQMMKYPPEKYYPSVKGSYDWLKEGMKADVSSVYDGEASRVWLRMDPKITPASVRAKRPVAYELWYEYEKDGQKIIDMVPGSWAADPAQAKELTFKANAEELKQAEIRRRIIETGMDSGMDPLYTDKVLIPTIDGMSGAAAVPLGIYNAVKGARAPTGPGPDDQRSIIRNRLGIGQ
jgi:hypothetical protein